MKIKLLALGLALGISLPVHADLILSGSPATADRSELNKQYEELAKLLSQKLGEPVRYVAPVNYQGYAQALRGGEYDLLIDGPHLAAWRIAKGLHAPVAEAKVKSSFLVVVPVSGTPVQSLEELVSRPVCVLSPPNLSTLMFLNQFPNPMQQPVLRMSDGYEGKIEQVFSGTCKAAVINSTFYETKVDKISKSKLNILYNTPPLPGYVFTASNKLSAEKRNALTKHLTTADPANDALVQAINKAGVRGEDPSKVQWVVVKPDAIKGFDEVLTKNSYGWD
ncbi:MAG: PhnD/SsuA/transferrin family substrate-binding protein [Halothiobacillaceae bacterium]|nr:PhnD/SsuA/transferrin family substrate-binding protein [Halothiobacillaceae bacterium]